MSKFLTTAGVSHRLEEIIKNANERLILISPYFNVNNRVKELLEHKDRENINIRVVCRESKLAKSEKKWFDSLASVQTVFRKNVHAKCYLNENEALLTSMNLYEYSQVNNDEMGILVSRAEDSDLYDSISKEADRLVELSNKRTANFKPVKNSEILRGINTSSNETPKRAYCIRCRSSIQFNPYKPYCLDCSKKWNKIKGKSKYKYPEKYCHSCGKEHEGISYNRPRCRSCYSQNPTPQDLKTSAQP